MPDRDQLLRRTFELAAEAREAGDHPFGALLAVDGENVAEAVNRTSSDRNLTAHAEIALVWQLEQQGQLGLLDGGTVYASAEPCPMCVGAMFWAGVRRVVYGLSAMRLQQLAADNEMVGFFLTAPDLGRAANPPMTIDGPHLEDEAIEAHLGFWER